MNREIPHLFLAIETPPLYHPLKFVYIFHSVKSSVYVTCKMFMRMSVKGKQFFAGLVVTMVTDNLYAPGEAPNVKKVLEKQIQ